MRFPKLAALAGLLVSLTLLVPTVANASLHHVKIQPIQVCDDNGLNCADPMKEFFEGAGDKIWAQAGIDLLFLPWKTLNKGDYLNLSVDTGNEFANLAGNPVANGGSSVDTILNLWFVDLLDNLSSFYGVTECLGCRNIAVAWDAIMAYDPLNYPAGRIDTIAHEVGHSLGLDHTTLGAGGESNLMTTGGDRVPANSLANIAPDGTNRDQLTAAQITAALDSKYVVPLPGTISLLLLGVACLARSRNREWVG